MPRRSKKHCHAFSKDATPDLLLVGSGNPSYRDQAHATAHPTCPCHCLVTLATRSPGRGAPCPPQEKNATVMFSKFNAMAAPWASAQPAIVFAERRGEVANGLTRAVSPSLDFGLCRRPDLGAHNPSGADASRPRHAHSADDIREPEPAGIGPPMVRAASPARSKESPR